MASDGDLEARTPAVRLLGELKIGPEVRVASAGVEAARNVGVRVKSKLEAVRP